MPGINTNDDCFQLLVQALSAKLGPSSGIDSADVDEEELLKLMRDYTSDESEWSKYFFPSPNHAYTRNLVDKGNGKSNLVSPSDLGNDQTNSRSSFWFGHRASRVQFTSKFLCSPPIDPPP